MISVVLLAYNEEESLPRLVPRIAEVLAPLGKPYRVVVVDDGSQDGTAAAARTLAETKPVVLLQHGVNKGVAKGFDTGIRHCVTDAGAGDLIFTMEADITNDPSILPEMIRELETHDVVCASRYQDGGAYVGFPLKRRIFSWGANTLARLCCQVPGVRDYTFFFRGYRAEVLRRAIALHGERFIERRGFAANAEILVKASKAGPLRCAEVPSVYRFDLRPGTSKMKVWRNTLEYLPLLWYGLTH
jgi:dolichol-phosphate mannosyltransferase